MTLNGVMAVILRYSTEFGIVSGAQCTEVVEDLVVIMFTFAISCFGEFLASFKSITHVVQLYGNITFCLLLGRNIEYT